MSEITIAILILLAAIGIIFVFRDFFGSYLLAFLEIAMFLFQAIAIFSIVVGLMWSTHTIIKSIGW